MEPDLQAAVRRYLAGQGGGRRAAAAALSSHYRKGGRTGPHTDPASYLTVRLPATYAAVAAVLMEVSRARPDFAPATLTDAGAGPGTAAWAALAAWPALARVTLLDTHATFLDIAGVLAADGPHRALATATRRLAAMDSLTAADVSDLVTCAYALAEVPEADIPRAAKALWAATAGLLVIVEPGTPAGFARIRGARTTLLQAGAVPVAPCPHAGLCPLQADDWCHFTVRLARRREHMHAKAARVPFEDEKYAYIALSRTGNPGGGARVLAPPQQMKSGITFKLCTAQGVEQRQVERRDRDAYKTHRKRAWGDLL